MLTAARHRRRRLAWALWAFLVLPGCLQRGVSTQLEGPERVQQQPLPPLVRSVLEAGASSLDVSLRMRSLELICLHVPGPELESFAQRALYDPSPYIRRTVVNTLARRLPEPEATSLLVAVAQRADVDAYTRGRAGFLLAGAGVLDAHESLASAWRQADSSWERAPLALAALVGGDAEAEAALAEALKDGSMPLETEFFVALGQTGHAGLAPALEEARELLEEELQLPVAVALLGLGVAQGEAEFRATFADGDVLFQLEAVDYLAQLEGPRADALLRKARSSDQDIVRTYAELVLVGRGEQPLGRAVEAADVRDREQQCLALDAMAQHVRVVSAERVSRRQSRAARELALEALSAPEPAVRSCAARAMGSLGTPADRAQLSALIGELSDEAPAEAQRLELAAALLDLQQRER
jgi:HEAT repeat protein